MKNVKSLLFLLTAVISTSFYLGFLSSDPLDIEPSETIITVEVNEPSEIAITDPENDKSGELPFIFEKSMASESTEPFIEIEESLIEPTENEQIEQTLIGPETTTETLDQFDYKSASVLPMYEQNGETYFILSREALYNKKDPEVQWTYDDFGGAKEREDINPLISAGREFFEEAILDQSLHFSLNQTYDFVDQNSCYIIANTTKRTQSKQVTYIVDLSQYKNQFITQFYNAREKINLRYQKHKKSKKIAKKLRTNLEKDKLALISWNDLSNAFINQPNYNHFYVKALVVNPQNQDLEEKNIKLRPYFVIKLRGFFLDKPYKVSVENEKVRFYS